MSDQVFVALIAALPGIAWAVLALVAILIFYRPIRRDVIPRMSRFTAMGMTIELGAQEVQQAIEQVKKPGVTYSPTAGATVVSRASRAAPVLRDSTILWIDDHPLWNTVERRLIAKLGVAVETATSTAEGISALAVLGPSSPVDLVISDMARPGDPDAGLGLLPKLRAAGFQGPVVFYIGDLDRSLGTPAGAFGITNRPDELLHLVMDALERKG